jgi:hypothetical protein
MKSDSLLSTCFNKNVTIIDSLFTTLIAIDTVLTPTSNLLVIKNGYTAIAKTFIDSTLCLTATGLSEVSLNTKEKSTLFPNPASDFIEIKITKSLNYFNNYCWIAIVNISGQNVFSEKVKLTSTGLKIDVSHFTSGLYCINIPELNVFNLKFIKSN